MNGQLDLTMRRIWERRIAFFGVFFIVVLITYAFLVIIDFIPEPKDEAGVENATQNVEEVAVAEAEDSAPTTEIDKKQEKQGFFERFFVSSPGEPEEYGAFSTGFDSEPTTGSVEEVAVSGEESVSETTTEASTHTVSSDSLPVRIIFEDLGDKSVPVLNPAESDIASLDHALLSGVVRHPESADFSEPGNIFILGHSSYLPNVLNKNFQAFNGIQKLTWGDTIRVQSGDTEYLYRVEEVFEAPASEIFVPETPGEAKLTLATCNVLGAKEDRYIVEAKLYDTKSL